MPRLITARNQLTHTPSFRVRGDSSWHSQASGAGQIMQFDVADLNVGGHYDTSTYKFKVPCDGVYHFSLSVYGRLDGSVGDNSNYYWGYLQINGANIGNQYIQGYQNAADYDLSHVMASATFEVKAGDLVHAHFYAQGTSCSYYAALCAFSGHLIG